MGFWHTNKIDQDGGNERQANKAVKFIKLYFNCSSSSGDLWFLNNLFCLVITLDFKQELSSETENLVSYDAPISKPIDESIITT